MRQNVCHFLSFTDKLAQPPARSPASQPAEHSVADEEKMFDRAEIIRWKCHKSNFPHWTALEPTSDTTATVLQLRIDSTGAQTVRVELGHRTDRNQLPAYKWKRSHAATVSISIFGENILRFSVRCTMAVSQELRAFARPWSHTQHQCADNDWPTILKYQIRNNANEHMSKHITLLRLSKLNQIILIYI